MSLHPTKEKQHPDDLFPTRYREHSCLTHLPDDANDLAEKIDYWLSHPEEKARMEQEYAKQGDSYRISASVKKAEEMFGEVIHDHREKHRVSGY